MSNQDDQAAPDAARRRKKRELSTVPIEVLAKSVYLTVPEAASYLRFPTVHAFECWLTGRAIPRARRGRVVLFFRKDLDAAVRPSYLPPPQEGHKDES